MIGAAHCGRRGLQKGVIGATIEKMVSKGAQPERIVATLGPCICGDCYEVGGDIADEFDAQFPGTFTLSRFGQPGIDIAAAALQELAKAGVPADNIVSSRPRVNAATQYLSEDEELAGHLRRRWRRRSEAFRTVQQDPPQPVHARKPVVVLASPRVARQKTA